MTKDEQQQTHGGNHNQDADDGSHRASNMENLRIVSFPRELYSSSTENASTGQSQTQSRLAEEFRANVEHDIVSKWKRPTSQMYRAQGDQFEQTEGSEKDEKERERRQDAHGERGTDIFRDTWVRYLGYANEFGESFRPLFPRLVVPSYLISSAYVLGDTADKSKKAYNACQQQQRAVSTEKYVASHAVDTLVWQAFASVIVPGFTINRVVRVAQMCIARSNGPPALHRWGASVIGLSVIPAIVEPIDHWMHLIMDRVVRPPLGVPPVVRKDMKKRD